MKKSVSILLALVLGSLLGFFGVFVSVFADSGPSERYITIGVILLVYCILSALWGFLQPGFSWLWGLIFGFPGVIFLTLYYQSEPNPFYKIYITLILVLSCVSGKTGSRIKTHRKK